MVTYNNTEPPGKQAAQRLFNHDDADVTGFEICTIPEGAFITRLAVVILEEFDASGVDYLDVGIAPGSSQYWANANISGAAGTIVDNNLANAISRFPEGTDRTLYGSHEHTGTAPTQGQALVIVEWIPPEV